MKFHLVALALAALSSTAFATTTASATTSNFGVTLKDLNANDGIAPGFTWDQNWSLGAVSSAGAVLGYNVVDYGSGKTLQANFGAATTESAWASGPTTTLAGTAVNGLGTYSASLSAQGAPTLSVEMGAGAGVYGYTTVQMWRGFWLTPGTQVTFSALIDREVAGSGYGTVWNPSDVLGTPTHAYSSTIAAFTIGNASNVFNLASNNDYRYNTAAYDVVGEADLLKLTLRNTGTTTQYYTFNFNISANIQELLDPAAAVPEPSTYALMALGLVAVGAGARRKKA